LRILHLSADYPDPVQPRKTRAIANLIALAPEHEHRVLSLNRRGGLIDPGAWTGAVALAPFADAAGCHLSVTYRAPPMGVLHRHVLERLADRLEAPARAFAPDLVHAHKLTVEGIVGERLAARLGLPFLLTVQGNTDLKIAGARPDLRPRLARIWRGAAVVLPFAPWAAEGLARLLGPRPGPVLTLPCPGPGDTLIAPRPTPGGAAPVLVSAFDFAHARNKNAARLIRAAARAGEAVPGLRLEILGAGDPGALAALADRVMPGRVAFPGPVPHDEIQRRFNAAAAFALVSHRETFGMVFAEALMAGTPCLYPRGRAIAGYLPDGGPESVVLSAEPRDEAGIAAALVRLVREEPAFKARLAALQESGGLDFLRRPRIAERYRAALGAAGARRPGTGPYTGPDTGPDTCPDTGPDTGSTALHA
jgi:glycosyltransferase involved in cell wall biosynthesis